MKKQLFTLAILIIAAVIVLAFAHSITPIINPQAEPVRTTLTGVHVCLPHKDTSGPTTLECASGLRTDRGEYYALNFMLMSRTPPEIPNGVKFSANGVITPVQKGSGYEKYAVSGVFSVTDGVKIETESITSPDILGTWEWKQTLLENGEKKYPAADDVFTVTFAKDGSLNGTTDCNNFFGGYTAKSKRLTFTPLAMTKKFCANSQEAEFVQMITDSDAYLINPDGELVLHLKSDSGSVVFTKK